MNTRKSTKSATRGTVWLQLELTANQAAALKRFVEKVTFEQASEVLYKHVDAQIRREQTHDIITAMNQINRALADVEISAGPWIDTGKA
jgi:predicted RNA-binding protein YlxR (DUF448 family)